MATAELAMALPSLVVVLGGLLWALTAVGAQLHCTDAAREAARAAARGDPTAQVRALASAAAPRGAAVTVQEAGGWVTVVVAARVAPLGGRLAAVTVTGRAAAALEPDTVP